MSEDHETLVVRSCPQRIDGQNSTLVVEVAGSDQFQPTLE